MADERWRRGQAQTRRVQLGCNPSLSTHEPIVAGVVITLNRDPIRRQRAIAEITAHPAIRVATLKDRWLPVAVEAANEEETHRVHHWITSLDGVDVADVVSLSCGAEVENAVAVA